MLETSFSTDARSSGRGKFLTERSGPVNQMESVMLFRKFFKTGLVFCFFHMAVT
jgi:hypothetical protein